MEFYIKKSFYLALFKEDNNRSLSVVNKCIAKLFLSLFITFLLLYLDLNVYGV